MGDPMKRSTSSIESRQADYPSRENCRQWYEGLQSDTDEYREMRYRQIVRAREQVEGILGYGLSIMEQRYLRDIAIDVLPFVVKHNIAVDPESDVHTLFPVQEIVGHYMRDVVRISLEELAELRELFGRDRVDHHLFMHHESLHCP